MRKHIITLALALAALFVGVSGAALGDEIHNETVEINDPSNETIEAQLDFGSTYSGETVVAELTNSSGATVVNATTTGTVESTSPISLNPTGLDPNGTYTLRVSTVNSTGAQVAADVNVTQTAVDVRLDNVVSLESGNGTEEVVVDVGFDGSESANATVQVYTGSTPTLASSTTLEYNGSSYSDDSGPTLKSAAFNLNRTDSTTPVTVDVSVSNASAYHSVNAGESSGLLPGIGGIESDTRLIVVGLLLVVGYLYVRDEDN